MRQTQRSVLGLVGIVLTSNLMLASATQPAGARDMEHGSSHHNLTRVTDLLRPSFVEQGHAGSRHKDLPSRRAAPISN